MDKSQLKTERLRLLALTRPQLALVLGNPAALEQELDIPFSRQLLADPVPRAINMKLAKMDEVAENLHRWYTYWLIVIAAEPFGAGMAGFKGTPDEDGAVEIGYGIDEAYRRQGYMTEAVRALIDWAFTDPNCHTVTALGVLRTNIGSNRVLTNAGMRIFREDAETQDWRVDKVAPAGSE